jgi:ABC-type Fe3+ transport system permease subunit
VRGSAWIPPLAAVALFAATVIIPLAALALSLFAEPGTVDSIDPTIILRSFAWAAAVSIAALIAGWMPARALAGAPGNHAIVIGALMAAPLFIPPYVHYWVWRLAWPPDSMLFQLALERDLAAPLREATLFIALVGWAWPIACFASAAALATRAGGEDDLLRLDGAGAMRRTAVRVRTAWPGLVVGGAIILLFTLNNTTAFDLAQVRTIGYELRAIDAEGGSATDLTRAALPGMAAAMIVIALAAWCARAPCAPEHPAPQPQALRSSRIGGAAVFASLAVLPLVLLLVQPLDFAMLRTLSAQYGRAGVNAAFAAAACGVLAAVVAIAFIIATDDRRAAVRHAAMLMAVGWAMLAAFPAMIVSLGVIRGWNRPAIDAVYDSPAIVVIALAGRFAFVGACLGMLMSRQEPREIRALRAIDGAFTLRAWWRAARPGWIAGAGAAFAIVFALSIAEVDVAGRVQPPRFETIARIFLDNMHYQRNEMVRFMAVLQVGVATTVSIVAVVAWRWGGASHRGGANAAACRAATAVACVAALAMTPGCDDHAEGNLPLSPTLTFGGPGRSPGQFIYPRAIDADPLNEWLWVADRSGRIQRFDFEGRPLKSWTLPSFDNGFPTGLTVAPDGRLFVADTHEHRVAIFDADGNLLDSFGSFGEHAGQFIFVTDVAFGADGRLYVSEFGGNDRVQVFDASFAFLFEFGGFGSEPGHFNRPQSLAFSADGSELFVADAVNNRIQVFDPDGRFLRQFGTTGTGAGEFRYPYGVKLLDDGSVLITEFGNSRLQVLSPAGAPLHVFGSIGSGPGELLAPWATAIADGRWFVLDSRNNRVHVLEDPR